ncbi:hypothetical protein PanWU01x14_196870 [Parasponia andersonii]|uniref:Uncharacterized protein n=1 Tax=Parasponia andersonii TaxID=3476 RepID=A0A2P5BZA9_PARAD|nr:hypothetical protein PanWU01x14_196870 [Parasponia andersonii]
MEEFYPTTFLPKRSEDFPFMGLWYRAVLCRFFSEGSCFSQGRKHAQPTRLSRSLEQSQFEEEKICFYMTTKSSDLHRSLAFALSCILDITC